ncbi:trihelix transcription factor PTL [Andrographis paniculata]|uniref:trihelix transcription factor PTL n=1 Tax=Andrographis paniculata TaxID=175694 RepID=UPI0021E7C3CD|nr:trihelix transcription factor PTL [Andrographis paniculata]
MEDQYGIADLRQYITSRPLFPAIPQPPDLLSTHRGLNLNPPPHLYDMLLFRSDSTTPGNTNAGGTSNTAAAAGCFSAFETGLNVGVGGCGGDSGAGRWPRQETLTLLEIRSRLDHKFKEANQKGPLWDEVSRIMSEEHGYQRSGKKCREKFENLYKYYKKTKEGKAGRQDGKHYRFFRQLEALYGDSNSAASASEAAINLAGGNYIYNYPNTNTSLATHQESFQGQKVSDTSLSLSNYSDADTSSSDNDNTNFNKVMDDEDEEDDDDDENNNNNGEGNDNDRKNKKRGKRAWKVKIRDFIDLQMKKLMEKQEAWMEKMMRAMEQKEQERMMREEEWRKQDAARMEKEHKFWASERAWIEARDSALMEALHKLTARKLDYPAAEENQIMAAENQNDDGSETMTNSTRGGGGDMIWAESEISRLLQLRTGMEAKFEQQQQSGGSLSEEVLWEEIATKMACFGHDRSGMMCKDKWDRVNNYLLKCNKKRKESTKGCSSNSNSNVVLYNNFQRSNNMEQISNQGGRGGGDNSNVFSCETSASDHTIRLNNDHGSSTSPNNTAAAMTENCLRYFLGDAYGRIMD